MFQLNMGMGYGGVSATSRVDTLVALSGESVKTLARD